MSDHIEITEGMRELLRKTADADERIANVAGAELALAVQTPLKEGILKGDITDSIYIVEEFLYGVPIEYPLDMVQAADVDSFIAYTLPNHGKIPEKHVEGDYVTVPTFDIGASIDYLLRWAKDARWNIFERAMEVLEAMFVRKINDDGWHTILMAVSDRNIVVNDTAATAGAFTKRLVNLMKNRMKRERGGNAGSLNRGKLTDLWISVEAVGDIRDFGATELDDFTRREMWLSEEGTFAKMWGVNLHEMDELGVGQEYQLYFTDPANLGAALAAADEELVVGLDLQDRRSFVMPVRDPLIIREDPTYHRQRRQSWYGWQSHGFGVLDLRDVIGGSF